MGLLEKKILDKIFLRDSWLGKLEGTLHYKLVSFLLSPLCCRKLDIATILGMTMCFCGSATNMP